MVNRIALLSLAGAALAAASLPHVAAAADYVDEGRGPAAYRGQDDGDFSGDREQRRDLRPARRAPGPVVYDERDSGRRFDRPAFGFGGPDGLRRGPGLADGPVYDEREAFAGPRFAPPRLADGPAFYRPAPLYRGVAAPIEGDAYAERAGLPDAGCTIEQTRSVTPAGWRKIVTHRTCYQR